MSRKFKTADYEEILNLKIRLGDALPAEHLACFIVEMVRELDLSKIYQKYSEHGAPPYAPEIMLGLLLYGYATGVFSSRKIEKATYEVLPFRFIAGDMHPDHDTIANFRKKNLEELKELFVQILLIAQQMGHLTMGNVSLDGSKIHADASKSKAVSYKRLLAIEAYLQQEVAELFTLAETADGGEVPTGMSIEQEVSRREKQLARLAEAKKVLEARAEAHYQAAQAEYEEKMQVRAEKAAKTGKKPRGLVPRPPTPSVPDKAQYNFTDPESHIMKNATNSGYDQHYNVQVVVEHDSRLLVGNWVCAHTNDKQAALPTIDTISPQLGEIKAANLDAGYFSEDNVNGILARGVDPYIATGRDPHNRGWRAFFAQYPDEPTADASVKEKMAYKLKTEIGKAIYRLRKSTVEPVIGIIKEVLGFRQFSLRGLSTVRGEWSLVCIAYNLKRMHTLQFA